MRCGERPPILPDQIGDAGVLAVASSMLTATALSVRASTRHETIPGR